jgi:flagellin
VKKRFVHIMIRDMDVHHYNNYKEVNTMGFRINTNIAALNSQRHLTNISEKLDKSLERLSSGLRINKSADDASGMATSVYLRGQIGGLNQAARNANDAISMTQTAEGALDISTNIILRLRDLAVQAATDTTNRNLLIAEADQLIAELTRVANDTEFVGNTLLNGSFTSGKIQIGANQGQTISFSIGDVRAAALGERATTTATLDSGTAEGGFSVGEFTINNRLVAATQETDDQVSIMDLVGTDVNVAGGSGAVISGLVINGATIATVTLGNGGAASIAADMIADLTEAVNDAVGTTNVMARAGSGNTIVLTADTGKNITFDLTNTNLSVASLSTITGLASTYFASGATNTNYNGETSAIAKVAAIDSIKSSTKVDALAVATEVTGSAAVAAGTLAAGSLYINGIDIGAVTVLDGDSSGALLAAINAKSSSTGVSASLDSQNRLVLNAADGRNVSVVAQSAASTATGISTDVYRGGVKLNSSDNFTITGSTDDLGNITAKTYSTSLDYAVSLIDLSTQAGADDALATLDAAMYQLNGIRSGLGAIQSRVSMTIMNLTTTSENLSASESRIRDVDFAEETAVFTKNSILTQAATAILAQANQLPQLALQLLG